MLTLNVSSGGRVMGQLELPAPLDEFKQKVDALCAAGQPNITPSVFNADSPVPALNWHLQQIRLDSDATLRKLNQLAEAIDKMNTAGHYHFCKALNTEYKQSLDEVLRTAAHIKPSNMDCYEIIPEVTTHQALGKWLVEHDSLEEKVPESLRPYLDYRSIGVDYCNTHEGEFLRGGYAGIRTGAMEQVLEEQGILHLTLTTAESWYYLTLPASEEKLEDAKRDLDVEDFAQAMIAGIKYTAPHLDRLISADGITVEDANTRALCLHEMEQEDGALKKFCAVLEAEQPDTFTEALNIAMDRDDYEQVPEDMDEYGKQVLRRAGADDEIIDTIDGYMDFSQLGEDSMEEDGVRRTEFGLVRRLSKPFPPDPEIGQTMM